MIEQLYSLKCNKKRNIHIKSSESPNFTSVKLKNHHQRVIKPQWMRYPNIETT